MAQPPRIVAAGWYHMQRFLRTHPVQVQQQMPVARRSRVLTIAAIDIAVVAASLLLAYLRLVREPWDLVFVVIIWFACPIGGMWLAASSVKEDRRLGVSTWQTALGLLLAFGVFLYGLLSMQHW